MKQTQETCTSRTTYKKLKLDNESLNIIHIINIIYTFWY